jgi:type IV pilus assembly protein PilM
VFFGSKRLIGIDVGSRFIKIVELDYSSKGTRLLNAVVTPTPEGSFSGADLINPELVGSVIAGTLQAEKIGHNKKVAFGLYGSSVMVKKITMPKVEKNVLNQQIRWEAEQYIPFDLNQIALTHHVNSSSQEADNVDVLIIAAQNSLVQATQEIARSSGLKLEVLDLSSFALANCFELAYPYPSGIQVLVHVGAHTTHVVVSSFNQVEFVRDISLGSHSCTFEIHKDMGLSIEESEALKIGASRGEGVPEDILGHIESFNQSVTEEIKNSIDYYLGSQSDGSAISQVTLSGGGSRTLGLLDKISSSVELPVQFLDLTSAFKSVSPSISVIGQDLPLFCPIAVGLALRKKGDG